MRELVQVVGLALSAHVHDEGANEQVPCHLVPSHGVNQAAWYMCLGELFVVVDAHHLAGRVSRLCGSVALVQGALEALQQQQQQQQQGSTACVGYTKLSRRTKQGTRSAPRRAHLDESHVNSKGWSVGSSWRHVAPHFLPSSSLGCLLSLALVAVQHAPHL